MSLFPNLAFNNTVFQDSDRNLLITNDLTTGNILFTSVNHNIPPQVLGTLMAEEDPRSTDEKPRIRIKRLKDDGTLDRYLVRKKLAWRFFCFTDGDQAPGRISTADNRAQILQETLDYLNNLFTEVPATTSVVLEFGPDDTLDAARDATNTTVLFDNGKEHAVNAIQAIQNSVGFIDVVDHATQQIHFKNVRHDKVTINGSSAGNTVTSVINALNALFTVNPLGAGYQPAVILPTLGGVPITYNQAEETTPVTTDPDTGLPHLQAATGNDPHGSRLWSNEIIDEAGEYFDFKITGKGQFLLGVYEKGVDEPELADGTTGNHHSGMYWSLSLYNYGSYMGPHTIYGSNPGLSYGPGWNGAQLSRYATNQELQDNHDNLYSNLWRVGINAEGYIYVAYYDAGRTNDYIMVARKSTLLNSGTQLGLAIKMINGNSTLVDVPTRTAVDSAAPALSYRYIESPDGAFYYPLFASADEAAYVDIQNGGADPGSAHAHTFIDEPTGTVWYMPDNGGVHAGPSAPSDGPGVTYTEIPTLSDDQFAPAAFTLAPVTANENTSINIELHPAGSSPSSFTTTVDASTLPSGIVNTGAQNRYLQGTLPSVPLDTTYNVLVTRTNAYGSTQGYQEINVVDVPVHYNGWTTHQGNLTGGRWISDSDPAVMSYNTPLSPGTRVRIPFEAQMKFGFVNATGDAAKETDDIFKRQTASNYFDLLLTVRANHTVNNLDDGIGWVFNDAIPQATAANNDTYFFEYRSDGFVEFINDDTGEVLLTSASAFTGDKVLFFGTPSSFTVNTRLPSISLETMTFTGDAVSGFTTEGTGAPLISANQLDDGSVVEFDAGLPDVHRLIIRKEWIEDHVLPALSSATGISQVFVGVPKPGADWQNTGTGNGDVAAEDFAIAAGFAMTDDYRASGWKLKFYRDGVQERNVLINSTTNGLYDVVLSNHTGDWSLQAGTDATTGNQATEPTAANGGSWNMSMNYNGNTPGPLTVVVGAQNVQPTLSETDLDVVREPFGPRTMLIGEGNSGNGKFGIVTSDNYISGTGHASTALNFFPPSITAGQTWTFIYDNSIETGDFVEYALASDNSTAYTTGITQFDNRSHGGYRGFTWVIPQDVPPIVVRFFNDFGAGFYDSFRDQPISGSTYTVAVTGIDLIGPSGNITGNTLTGNAWFKLSETLGAGERVVIDGPQLQEIYDLMGNGDNVFVGLKGSGWSESSTEADLEGIYLKIHKPSYGGYFLGIYGDFGNGYIYHTSTSTQVPTHWSAFIELTATGNNIRIGTALSNTLDPASTSYADWASNSTGIKNQTGDQGFGYSAEDVVFYFKRGAQDFDTSGVTWTSLTEVATPGATPSPITPFSKAIDFNGQNEHLGQTLNGTAYNPLRMGGGQTQVPAHSDLSRTSDSPFARPWAVTCVFKLSNATGNGYIWAQSEGVGASDDRIYLRTENSRLYFGWGRDGEANEMDLGFTLSTNNWEGVYVGYKGQRFNAADATVQNLADSFDIRLMGATTLTGSSYRGQFSTLSPNYSTPTFWNLAGSSVGARTNRNIEGDFLVGGLGSSLDSGQYVFQGKVASCMVTTLMIDAPMPDEAEIKAMITDPEGWLTDYKVGNTFRYAISDQTWSDFQLGGTQASWATQVWLMGDGSSDSYPNIYNSVTSTNVATLLTMTSMVANDIETVNIPGLS